MPEVVAEGAAGGAAGGALDGGGQRLLRLLGDEAAEGRDSRGGRGAAGALPRVRQTEAADGVIDVHVQVDEPRQDVTAAGLDNVSASG